MAFLVAGTLRLAAQMADTRDSLRRKGKYSLQGPRVALILSSPGVSAAIVAAVECVFQALGFESCEKRQASVQGFLEELVWFREWLDAHGGPMGCAIVALVAPNGQLRQPRQLVWELSRCEALRGCPKVFLLLSSGPRAAPEPGAFLAGLRELCGCFPHWSLVQLLTELFCRVAKESAGGTRCPILQSSLRGTLCLRDVEPWMPEAFQKELAQFREQLDTRNSPVSCALVALMAHGGPQGQLVGADGQEVQLEVLKQELSHCRALQDRPKIFLLQACRGGNRDAGVGPTALPWYWRWLQAPPAIPSHADVLQIYADAKDSSSRYCLLGSSEQADILTVYSAAEGYVAYRDEKGSDFIQTLVEVLQANPGRDLVELLTEHCCPISASPWGPSDASPPLQSGIGTRRPGLQLWRPRGHCRVLC
ncbi:caspase-14-like isoform X3 [Nycticebus coucang]|uniref:caspase-14-like isoform X3 n=1 Tax=Nycticebus coucang TaxID=9470 RepID=UPI00234C7466|nr:caspase-14-like isoform X3 [Nycticebus coucang]